MNSLLIIIFAVLAFGFVTVGILNTDIMLEVQNFLVLGSIAQIEGDPNSDTDGTFFCQCENPAFDPDAQLPPENIEFDEIFCDFNEEPFHFVQSEELCTMSFDGPANANSYGNYEEIWGQGCTVGFWRDLVDSDSGIFMRTSAATFESLVWPLGYSPDYSFNDMFQTNLALPIGPSQQNNTEVIGRHDVATEGDNIRTTNTRFNQDGSISDPTLLQALNARGGGINLLARESVAAMLNSAHDDVNYMYDINEVMEMTQEAIVSSDYMDAIIAFKTHNNAGRSSICN